MVSCLAERKKKSVTCNSIESYAFDPMTLICFSIWSCAHIFFVHCFLLVLLFSLKFPFFTLNFALHFGSNYFYDSCNNAILHLFRFLANNQDQLTFCNLFPLQLLCAMISFILPISNSIFSFFSVLQQNLAIKTKK